MEWWKEASLGPGPGVCLITTFLCGPGQVAKPLWLSVLLAKQGRIHQSQSLQVWGGLSASQDMTTQPCKGQRRFFVPLLMGWGTP